MDVQTVKFDSDSAQSSEANKSPSSLVDVDAPYSLLSSSYESLTKLNLGCVATDSINDVEYEEVDGKPGISIEHSDGTKCWSLLKISKKNESSQLCF